MKEKTEKEETMGEKRNNVLEKRMEKDDDILSSNLILNLEEKITRFETEMKSLEEKVTKLEKENKKLKDGKKIVFDVGQHDEDGFWSPISNDSSRNKDDNMTYTCVQCSA